MRRRQGFTLVEMLVAMALIIFIMTILSEAFVAGLETFRQLKAVGDMQEKLRSVAITMRRDLAADHFEPGRRLSDPNFATPQIGFFRFQGTLPILEGVDGDGIPSYYVPAAVAGAPGNDHILHFSAKIRATQRDENQLQEAASTVAGPFPPNPSAPNSPTKLFRDPNGTWAEIAYFLRPTGASAGTTPLYALYRRQLWVLPYAAQLNTLPLPGTGGPPPAALPGARYLTQRFWRQFSQVSCQADNTISDLDAANNKNKYRFLYFNTEYDLAKRFNPATGAEDSSPAGLPSHRSLSNFYWYPKKATLDPPPLPPGLVTFPYTLTSPPLPATAPPFMYDQASASIPLGGRDEENADNSFPPGGAYPGNAAARGDDLLLTDVIAFTVQFFPNPDTTAPSGTFGSPVFSTHNPKTPEPRFYDTADSSSSVPIRAVQITLRIWDNKTQQARQVTIIQDL